MFDEELIQLAYQIGLYHLERGIRDFSSFKNKLIEECGDRIRPYIIPTYAFFLSSPEVIKNEWLKEMTPYNQIKQSQAMDDNLNSSIVNTEDISIGTILRTFKSYSERKRAKDIKTAVCVQLYPDSLLAKPEVDDAIDRILRDDKRLGDESWLTYSKGYYSKRKRKLHPIDVPMQISEYTGRGGECAVMSELLFHSYNVNRMMIDEGVDLVAVKDNIYYYIQVKTRQDQCSNQH